MSVVFEVTILGVNSAVPVFSRHPSSQVLVHDGTHLMIDCGEGTQSQLTRCKIKRSKIEHIFISHLHGDHCFGLPGLLTTSSLQRRTTPLTIHGPRGLHTFIDTVLRISGSHLGYELEIKEYDTEIVNTILVKSDLTVTTFPLKHRIPTMGYRFQEHRTSVNIKTELIAKYNLSIEEIKAVKNGADVQRDDTIPNAIFVVKQKYNRSYAYVSDTVQDMDIIPHIDGVSTLYHETTYLDDLRTLADERMHTTIGGAISVAQKASAGKLITGHYSSRYKDISVFYDAGRRLWDKVELGEECRTYPI